VLTGVETALLAAAFAAGWTGTWSPCGFSMIETVGPRGHSGGIATTLAACATFLPGALLGGAVTFGQLAVAGDVLDAGGSPAFAAAAVIAAVAALLELRGARIVPQVRRQLPEDWRRRMPLPLAAALYGVLLGLGFTTFVLTFGVWALAAISFVLGDPGLGLALGLAFGLGRALPVVAVAPFAARPLGARVMALMAERPILYRAFRLGDGALLAGAALALATAPAVAAKVEVRGGADPSVVPGALVWQAPDGTGFVLRDGTYDRLSGNQPAVGGPYAAVLAGNEIKLLDRHSLQPLGSAIVPGADGLAVSRHWLAYRVGHTRGDKIAVRRLGPGGNPGPAKTIAATGRYAQLSRPALDHSLLVFSRNSRRASRLVKRRLKGRHNHTILRSHQAGLFNPSVRGRRLAYVRSVRGRDRLMVRSKHGHGRGHAVFSQRRRRGWVWSTALTRRRVFFTVLRSAGGAADLLSVRLGHRR
jgi:hypothetical protein